MYFLYPLERRRLPVTDGLSVSTPLTSLLPSLLREAKKFLEIQEKMDKKIDMTSLKYLANLLDDPIKGISLSNTNSVLRTISM